MIVAQLRSPALGPSLLDAFQHGDLDIVRACVIQDPNRCVACDSDADCADGYTCAAVGGSSVCLAQCTFDSDCVVGTSCTSVGGGFGNDACVPLTGTCDNCFDGDGDGYGTGSDCAVVDCDDRVFSIAPGRAELCNGYDDNCVGDRMKISLGN